MARIVVVDDEHLVAESCAVILRAAGYEVSIAHDGESGIRLIMESQPDVVVSDVRMPGLDGHELVAILKAQTATAHIPVLLMSGHCFVEETKCDAFLSKPFLIPHLLAAVRRLATRGVVE